MKFDSNITLTIVGTLIVAAGAYWYFFTGTGTDAPLTTDASQNAAQVHFQTLIAQLPASFDTAIFSEPNFLVLVDITVPIEPENSGRIDPFAPFFR
ncbi:hypothetical protein A3A36_00490 [Candidatus Kaiserbacteria bacterium RIFCSPLOWO2_01_FULL_52_12b]|uniref:Uncharacterized protein n=1 Tax=Candidatus Kaiserbacteria bacterium RIFCSPLOWO2_01_FULL_52_12b TaxID=1798509 RepID=A0A1F6EYA0_9BACT|nr:MAG: hypothetical protein A3A36_00490 [Candidatus Kaiserbacteria bacterium RIFCSPLOWO2_01_FULL_52_12b]